MDIQKQIAYWRDSAAEDFAVAVELIKSGRLRHSLFFMHLVVEKLLKAHVCKATNDFAPKSHNLEWLAGKAHLGLDEETTSFFSELTVYNILGRYAEVAPPQVSKAEAREFERRTAEVMEWLNKSL